MLRGPYGGFMKFILALSCLMAAMAAQADVLTITPGSRQIEGVPVAQTATLNVQKQQIPLQIVGAGLRTKRVIIANVKVYVGQLLSSDASQFVRTPEGALKSLDHSRTTVMLLTFLRNVDAGTVGQAFKDSLQANHVDLNDPSISAFLKMVQDGGDALNQKSMMIAIQKNSDRSETLYYQSPKGTLGSLKAAEGLTQKIMSIWLAQTTDSGTAALKASLIRGN